LTRASREESLRPWLALLRIPGLGGQSFGRILDAFGSPEAAFARSSVDLKAAGLRPAVIEALKSPDWGGVDRDLDWLAGAPHRHCLTLQDDRYPALLREIPDPPPLLFVNGNPDALSFRQLAVVGSRNPSPQGFKLATDFARALVPHGFAVTSGLALGIDGASHRGALEGGGTTIAVVGTGPDDIYPSRHQSLHAEIVESGGAVVSELPTGVTAQASNFPKRNRIISGLSLGTLVVEAALRSGSLITARMALEQNREVFAIPGSNNNPLARGCNALIREGAKLVETVSDILEELRFETGVEAGHKPVSSSGLAPNSPEADLLKYVAYDPTSVDTLVAATGKTPEAISSLLLILELQGHVVSLSGGHFCRNK
jgi:DNA processing protein